MSFLSSFQAAQIVLISLFELNTPEFTMLLGALPKTFQDGATKLLHNHLKNSSNTSVVRGLFLVDSSSLISCCRCSVAWNTRNCCLEAVWQHRLLFAFIGTIKTNSVIFKCNIVITNTDFKKRRSTWKLVGFVLSSWWCFWKSCQVFGQDKDPDTADLLGLSLPLKSV